MSLSRVTVPPGTNICKLLVFHSNGILKKLAQKKIKNKRVIPKPHNIIFIPVVFENDAICDPNCDRYVSKTWLA